MKIHGGIALLAQLSAKLRKPGELAGLGELERALDRSFAGQLSSPPMALAPQTSRNAPKKSSATDASKDGPDELVKDVAVGIREPQHIPSA